MRISQINLDMDGDRPESCIVELSHDEMLFISLVLGAQTGTEANKVLPGGDRISSEIYLTLTGQVFNRFYEDGLREAKRETSTH